MEPDVVLTDLEANLPQQSIKQKVLEAVESLRPDATIEDAMERLFLIAKIERHLDQREGGGTISHEEAKERLLE